jgi:ankyrin repeat protein
MKHLLTMTCMVAGLCCLVLACSNDFEKLEAAMDDPQQFKQLVVTLDDVNIRDDLGQTLLVRAGQKGKPEIAAILMEAGANPLLWDNMGNDALDWPVSRDMVDFIAAVFDASPDMWNNRQVVEDNLNHALKGNSIGVVTWFLDRGISSDYRFDRNVSPLHVVAPYSNTAIDTFTLLLERGADPNTVDSNGRTPLFLIIDHADYKISQMLYKAGADLNHRDTNGHTAMFYFALNKRLGYIKTLLELGAVPEQDMFVMDNREVRIESSSIQSRFDYTPVKLSNFKTSQTSSETVSSEYARPLLSYAEKHDPELAEILREQGYQDPVE